MGDNDQDILLGIQALEKAGGGYCLARDGKLLEVLPLPVCGLLTQEPTEQVQRALANMKKLCVEMGMQRSWTHSRRYLFCRCRFCRKFGLPTERL